MTRQAIYDRLRAIGVSVESADAVSEALEPLPDKKVEAFLLCANGMTERKACKICQISKGAYWRMICKIKRGIMNNHTYIHSI